MAVSRINEAGLNINQYGNRNLIINGAMQVAQRGTSSQITGASSTYETVDRFINYSTAYSTLVTTQSQSTDVPSGSGFENSFKVNVDTAESAPANGFIDFRYKSESQDMKRLAYGTSSAKTMTLSFWVKSNVTGTYNISFYIDDANKVYNVTYTIDASATWEYKTVKVTGNTNSGQGFNNDNGVGLYVAFTLSAGTNYKGSPSTNAWGAYSAATWGGDQTADVAGTASNYWQITGVQLEVGDTATDFEHRSFGDEEQKCQRYYYRMKPINPSGGVAHAGAFNIHARSSTAMYGVVHLPTAMRTTPSIAISATADMNAYHAATTLTVSSFVINGMSTAASAEINVNVSSGASAGTAGWIRINKATGYIEFNSEL